MLLQDRPEPADFVGALSKARSWWRGGGDKARKPACSALAISAWGDRQPGHLHSPHCHCLPPCSSECYYSPFPTTTCVRPSISPLERVPTSSPLTDG